MINCLLINIIGTICEAWQYVSNSVKYYPDKLVIWDEHMVVAIDKINILPQYTFAPIPNNRSEVRKMLQQKSWLVDYISRCIKNKKKRKLKLLLAVRYQISISEFKDVYAIADKVIKLLKDDIVILKDKYDKLSRLGDVS